MAQQHQGPKVCPVAAKVKTQSRVYAVHVYSVADKAPLSVPIKSGQDRPDALQCLPWQRTWRTRLLFWSLNPIHTLACTYAHIVMQTQFSLQVVKYRTGSRRLAFRHMSGPHVTGNLPGTQDQEQTRNIRRRGPQRRP